MPLGTNLPEALTPLFAVVTLPAGILAGLFVGLEAAAVVFVVGWLLLVPATAILFGPPGHVGMGSLDDAMELAEKADELGSAADGTDGPERDPIEALRERYAAGEIDEVELERRLDALLELEDVDAEDEERIERAIERIDAARERSDADAELETL